MTALVLLLITAPVDLLLCHEGRAPVWVRLGLPEGGKVRLRATPAAQPMSAALTRALVKALADKDAARVMRRHDTDEDGCLSAFELVPDLLTAAGKPGRPRFTAALKGDDWLADLREHYGSIDETKFAALKPVEITLAPERRHVREAGGLTIDAAITAKAAAYTLFVSPQPRGWFEWLDADGDGGIGLVELRSARKRLTDDAGRFAAPDPKATHYSLTLVPAGEEYGVRLRRPEGRVPKGPAWFVAMDGNADGHVSPDEWLGTPEAFARLDKDGDGLISPREAEAAK